MKLIDVRSWSLRTQVLALLLVCSVLPIAAGLSGSFYEGRRIVKQDVERLLAARAEHLASEIDSVHKAYRGALIRLARRPYVVARLSAHDQAETQALNSEVEQALNAFMATDPNLRSVVVLDAAGKTLFQTADVGLASSIAEQPFFSRTREQAKFAMFGPFVPVGAADEQPLIAYSAPVQSREQAFVGAVVFLVRVSSLWDSVRAANGRAGSGSYAVVLDRQSIRIAHSAEDDLVFRPAGPLPTEERRRLIAERRFGEHTEALVNGKAWAPREAEVSRAEWSTESGAVTNRFVPTGHDWYLSVARRLSTVDWTVFVLVPQDAVYGSLNEYLTRSFAAALLLIAVAGVAGLLFTRAILQPVRDLIRASQLVSGGDFSVRVLEPQVPDLKVLARQFNDMTASMQNARDELERQVQKRTQELREANFELVTQREELLAQQRELETQGRELEKKNYDVERADRLKSEFLANMSHELRTPLNSVIGFTELVLVEGKQTLPERHAQYLKDVLTSGRHLLSLINDILDLSKIEAGRMTLTMTSVSPADAVAEAISVVSRAAAARSVEIVDSSVAEPEVTADPGRLRQILLNLLSNAVKFTKHGTKVFVTTRVIGSYVEFEVRDQGPGVDPSIGPNLFEPFVQGESALVKTHQGTGLGLAITKRLVKQHGGELAVDSQPGIGATFRFTLPCTPALRAATAEQPRAQEAAGKPAPPRHGGPPRILIIDDDPSVSIVLKDALEPEGYEVLGAVNGRLGLEQAIAKPPDLVIVDMRLPDMSGFDVVDQLRAHPVTQHSAVVVLTAYDLSDEQQARLRPNVECIALKGDVLRSELMAAVHRLTSREPPASGRPLVLIVDDHDMNRELVRGILARRGVAVEVASDGESGIAATRRLLPDLVLMDLSMPKKDGFEATRELKSDAATRTIPVVALTALAMRGDEEKARAAGVDDYLTKPIAREALEQLVSKYIRLPLAAEEE